MGRVSASPDAAAIADAVRDLDAGHDRALSASYVLQAGGEQAALKIRDNWQYLSLLGQRRALSPLSRLASDYDAAIEALVVAARSDDEEIRAAAFAALERSAPRGRDGLVVLVFDPVVGDRAAASLARTDPTFALEPLLSAMQGAAGADRPGLRYALAAAVRRSEDDPERRVRNWLAGGPDPAAVGSAAAGLASIEDHRELIAALIEYAAPKSNDFPTAWRLLQSAKAAGPSEQVDRWVRSQLDGPEQWMLREAAVDAITARGHRQDARASLGDPYPRVRARAAMALSGDSASLVGRATLARRDIWPMVRADAVRSLRTEGEAIPVIVAAVDDSMSMVRVAAIEVLTASSHEEGWARIHRRLRASNEWPQVTVAAIDYVVAHCRTDAVQALLRLVLRASPSDAGTDDLNNAARAIVALRILGTPEAEAAVEQLRLRQGVPPTLKMALEQPLAEDSRCPRTGR
ncbi:MAG: hypothetical protein WCE62_11590 [Polyangiales bacterium]